MAQAARLNLRMQKELKLLLTDPPPGASFPSLYAAQTTTSTSSSGPSLSSIDAQIEGPEETVYAKGFFKLKIQIPDRYPFQPPLVTFATPIYHPNIDNGGRICLDILNLPPKGAWQPSLNISTVLTSIGLLLSEPNPDDGLMHEASQEYKYNRQAFDHKARSMTEKYARIGASESADVGQCSRTLLNSSMDSADSKVSDTSMMDMTEYLVSSKRFCGISRKLSLESSELDQERNDGKIVNEVQSKHLYERQMELKGLKQEPNRMHSEQNQTHEDLQRMKKKLSLETVKKDNDKIDLVSKHWESTSRTDSSKSLTLVEAGFNSQQKPNQNGVERSKSNSKDTELEKEELLNSLDSKQGMGDDQKKLLSVAQQSATQCHSSGSQKNFPMPHTINKSGREGHCEIVDVDADGFMKIKHKKLGLAGRQFSSGMLVPYQCLQKDDSENLASNSSFALAYSSKNPAPSSSLLVVSKAGHCHDRSTLNYSTTCLSQNSYKTEHRQPFKLLTQSSNSNNGNIQSPSKISTVQHDSCWDENLHGKQDCMETFAVGIKKQEEMPASFDTDTVIVLDSEDSDEDQGRAGRSKLSLARRRLPGKLKP